MERPERWKVLRSELVEALRRRQVLEAVLAEVAQLNGRVEQPSRRLRDQNLPAVPGAHDPRRTVDVEADIPLFRHDRLARVDPDSNPYRSLREPGLNVCRRGNRVARAGERDEERVALRVHFEPAVARECVADHAAVLRQYVGVALPELVKQARGALDIGEEECDGPARRLGHALMIAPHRGADKSSRSADPPGFTIVRGVGVLPEPIEELLATALVGELTVIDDAGRLVTHPLIPFYDGELIYLTSSVLFSRKLEHIKANPKVSLSISDPVAVKGDRFHRATIQGDAVVDDSDLHAGWERVLPLWREKEPVIDMFLGKRVALPLFFERAVIEISPRRAFLWEDGRTDRAPQVFELAGVAR